MTHKQSIQQGVGLVEVMVSLLLLAVAVLAYAALQVQAIKSTDESLQRSQSLVMMRNLGEKVRTNPSAIMTYANQLNEAIKLPDNNCGLDGRIITVLCSPDQLAKAESYYFKEKLVNTGLKMTMYPCPTTREKTTDSIMYSYCLLSAWGDTTPTIAQATTQDSNGAESHDCISNNGSYLPKATCIMMEL